MHYILGYILSKLGITAVISEEHHTHRDLSSVCYKYICNGKFYKVTSFYTAAWIGPSPFGPTVDENGLMLVENLSDIATMEEYSTLNSLRTAATITSIELEQWYLKVDNAARSKTLEIFSDYQEYVKDVCFTFLPTPSMIVALGSKEKLFGSVSVDARGNVDILMRSCEDIDSLVENVRIKALPSANEVVV